MSDSSLKTGSRPVQTQADNPSSPSHPKPFQFSLRQLLLATLLCAAFLAVAVQFGIGGIVICFFAASFGAVAYGAIGRNKWFFAGLPGVFIFGLGLLLPSLGTPRTVARRSQCQSHLKVIALALHSYHDVHGSFPPAYIPDATGKPMHSWRVLILPYLERKDLYDRYNFSEPWDGPNNRKLAAEMPREFACPCQPRPANGPLVETNYLAIVGPNTAWPDGKAVHLSQVSDGTSNTLLVVEVHDSGISWLEPRDLHISQMATAINPPRGQGISSRHGSHNDKGPGSCAMAIFCDGHTEVLHNDLPPDLLRAMLTARGGEDVSRHKYWDQ